MDNHPTMDLYAARIARVMGLLFVIISAGGFVYHRSAEGAVFALGAAVCCAHNVLKVYWLKNSVAKATVMDAAYSVNFVRGQGMLRMLFTLAVLVGAGFLSQWDVLGLPFLVGAVFGMMAMPVANYSMAFFAKRDYGNKGESTDV
jgi:hypothetical protein